MEKLEQNQRQPDFVFDQERFGRRHLPVLGSCIAVPDVESVAELAFNIIRVDPNPILSEALKTQPFEAGCTKQFFSELRREAVRLIEEDRLTIVKLDMAYFLIRPWRHLPTSAEFAQIKIEAFTNDIDTFISEAEKAIG